MYSSRITEFLMSFFYIAIIYYKLKDHPKMIESISFERYPSTKKFCCAMKTPVERLRLK